MFKQLQNIDSAFKYIRLFSLLFLLGNIAMCCYVNYEANSSIKSAQRKVYILSMGKLMDAVSVDRSDSLAVEIRDHVKMFHFYFYWLEPDDEIIKKHITNAFYLADASAKQEYDNLLEKGYYSNIVSGNITQQVEDYDSIQVDINQYPYRFEYFGKLKIIRSTSTVTRSLISEGFIRNTGISTNNSHGFIIQDWKVLENKDLTIDKR